MTFPDFGYSRNPAFGQRGISAAAHPMAARAGAEMLRRGGNAVDAAIASAFTLSVVEPYNSGLGGGGFLLVRDGGNGAITIVDYREKAPASATRDMYIGPDGNPVPGASLDGYRAAGVPGTVAGLCRAAERFARLPLATLLGPAIEIAEHGFPADERYIACLLYTSDAADE